MFSSVSPLVAEWVPCWLCQCCRRAGVLPGCWWVPKSFPHTKGDTWSLLLFSFSPLQLSGFSWREILQGVLKGIKAEPKRLCIWMVKNRCRVPQWDTSAPYFRYSFWKLMLEISYFFFFPFFKIQKILLIWWMIFLYLSKRFTMKCLNVQWYP